MTDSINKVPSRSEYLRARVRRLVCVGLLLVSVELAVFHHLSFALSHEALSGKDSPLHMTMAINVNYCGASISRILTWYASERMQNAHYPPLTYALSSAVMSIYRGSPVAGALASRAIWIVVLAGSLFGAGQRIGKSPWAGLAAAAVGGLSPMVLLEARHVDLELPTLAAVALGVYGLTLTDGFRKPGASVLCGILFGVGLLTKPTTAFYLAPLALASLALPSQTEIRPRARARNAAFCLGVTLAAASIYYLPSLHRLFKGAGGELVNQTWDLKGNLLVYANAFPNELFPPVIAALVAAATVWLAVRRDRWLIALAVSSLTAFAILMLMQTPSATYLYPLQALGALAIARSLAHLPVRMRNAAAGLLSLTMLAPLALPFPDWDAEREIPVNETALRPLRTIYGVDPGRLSSTAIERGTVPWEHYSILDGILGDRYHATSYDDVVTVDVRRGQGLFDDADAFRIAMALVEREKPWSQSLPHDRMSGPRMSSRFLFLLKQSPLVVVARPFDQENDPDALDVVNEVVQTHALDFQIRHRTSPWHGYWYQFYRKKDTTEVERNR